MLLRLESVCKSYDTQAVLQDVSFTLAAGTILGVVGPNGAGKSALASLLAGHEPPDRGRLILRAGSREWDLSKAPGVVAWIPQTPRVARGLRMIENVFLGEELGSWTVDRRAQEMWLDEVTASCGIVAARDGAWWSAGGAHRVGILRAMARSMRPAELSLPRCPVLVIDEATHPLSESERAGFLDAVKNYAKLGNIVILISHDLEEVVETATEIFVINHEVAAMWDPPHDAGDTAAALRAALEGTGIGIARAPVAARASNGTTLISVEIQSDVSHTTLELSAGEVVVTWSPTEEERRGLFDFLSGTPTRVGGRLVLRGVDVTTASISKRREEGMRFVPPAGEALVSDMSLRENLQLARLTGLSPRSRKTPDKDMACLVDEFTVKPCELTTKVRELSGGNRQKLVVARELWESPRNACVVAYDPTKGLDSHATSVVKRRLRAVAESGGGVLAITVSADALHDVADRTVTFAQNRFGEA